MKQPNLLLSEAITFFGWVSTYTNAWNGLSQGFIWILRKLYILRNSIDREDEEELESTPEMYSPADLGPLFGEAQVHELLR
ncbi:hypothetical protein CPB83DRAFT_845522 [Crepidotus variabilis]|uniref:Uncharacterized protein n=1 Tax=Crepidotus variabilis TaxID=179855 RepID=A0A9P6ERG1_9AGAR|nr:hypothetical protein CPB83DRAFT_845522 [Crepidotus variabilis]